MRPIKTLTPVDLAIRGLFLAVIAIGGVVGRIQQTNAEIRSAETPGQTALSGMVAGGLWPASAACPAADAATAMPASTSQAGGGYLLHGRVRSRAGCVPIGAAKIEFWPAEAQAANSDAQHILLQADADGAYRLRCNVPKPATGEHAYFYLRVSAAGYTPSVTRYQLKEGQTEDSLDIVLEPEQ